MTPDHQERPPFGNPTKARYFLLGFLTATGLSCTVLLTIAAVRLVAAAFPLVASQPSEEVQQAEIQANRQRDGIADDEYRGVRETPSCASTPQGDAATRSGDDIAGQAASLGKPVESLGVFVGERPERRDRRKDNRGNNNVHAESPSRGVIA